MKLTEKIIGACFALFLASCQSPSSGGQSGPVGHDYTWAVAGSPNFNSGTPPSLAVDSTGAVYAAFADVTTGKVTVQRYGGTEWAPVGQPGSGPVASIVSLTVDSSDIPYVVYRDSAHENKASSLRFNGQDWEPAGTAGFGQEVAGAIGLVAGSNGALYCAFNSTADPGPSVYAFNGTTWSAIKPADGSFDGLFFLQRNSLASDRAGNVYIALQGYALSDPGINVFKHASGATWQKVGKTFAPTTGISNDQLTISVDKAGKPYATYIENPETDHQSSVMKFSGTDWVPVGKGRFSPQFSYDPTIVVDSTGAPYVTLEPSFADGGQAVLKFDGETWVPSASSSGISAGAAQLSFDCSFVVGPSDVLYVSFLDDADGDGDGTPIVMVGNPH